ncbi:uncharacterized protein DSM5745_09795 [Aspergillus mulundensis]|uniref:Zinc finger PHD-type domain-containing protein n=1 Tax=Aspergillus mulundensis TaxID=1810919 RepID=A0A3D8QSB7_9EURO|nr:hypothetical protein DSM5745_09795 [Aspergillus mulundensis]RDW64384.1 hypothetical protein DSM5745_09795 [Aspergillus mulundensis]
MPPRKGQARNSQSSTGRIRGRRSLPAASPAAPARRETEWDRTVARIAAEPMEAQVRRYKEWKRNGSRHDTTCRVCLDTGNSATSPYPLIGCHACAVAFHFPCVPKGIDWAADGDLYCPICIERKWNKSPPELTPPASPVLAPAEPPKDASASEPALAASATTSTAISVSNPPKDPEPEPLSSIPQAPQEARTNPLPSPSDRKLHSPAVPTRPASLQQNVPDSEGPHPKRQRTSRFTTLSSEVDTSLAVLYRELESVATLKMHIEELQQRDRQNTQMIKLRDNSIAILRRDLERRQAENLELTRRIENIEEYDEVKKQVDELKKRNEALEAELRKSREETATAQELVESWKGKLAQLLNT